MEKIKLYNVKIKLQQKSEGLITYNPVYVRFLVKSNDIKKAKEKALSAFTGNDKGKFKISIVKTTLIKIDGFLSVKD